jgi:hypothetical protein
MHEQEPWSSSFGDGARSGIVGSGVFPDPTLRHSKLAEKDRGVASKTIALRWRKQIAILAKMPSQKRGLFVWLGVALVGALGLWAAKPKPIGVEPRGEDPGWAAIVPAGKRAYTIENEILLPLRAGDRFDLFGYREERGGLVPILENILVLGVYAEGHVVVALRPEDIAQVEMAQQQGKLRIAIRGSGEEDLSPRRGPPKRLQSKRKTRNGRIEIWEERE